MPKPEHFHLVTDPPAVAGTEDHGDETLVVGELYNESVAEDMNKFIKELAEVGADVGISAFLIFALKYRKHVRVWYDLRHGDLLHVYVPWAVDFISDNA